MVRAAWILLYLVVLGSLGFLLLLTGKTAIDEIQQLAQTVSVQDKWTSADMVGGQLAPRSGGRRGCPRRVSSSKQLRATKVSSCCRPYSASRRALAAVVSGVLVILFLSLYWIVHQVHFERLWLSLLPSGQRKQARGIWRTVEPDIGAYVRSQGAQSLLAGLLLGLGYWLLGSPYPALLALIGALASLIPLVGIALAVFPVLLVGLLTGVQLTLITVLYTLVVMIALSVWAKPRLFNRRWDNPILTVTLLIAMADAFGFVGIIVAPLLSVVCQILWSRLVSHRLASGAADQVSDLVERQEHVWATIRAMDEPHVPLVISSMERLTRLMAKAEPILQAALPAEPSDPLLHIASQPEQDG